MKRLILKWNGRYEAFIWSSLYLAGLRLRLCHFKGTKSLWRQLKEEPKNLDFHEDICDYFMIKSRHIRALHLWAIFYLCVFDSKGVSFL